MRTKFFYLSALAIMAGLASCTNDETVDAQQVANPAGDALIMRPAVNGLTRVITDYNNSTLNQFRVIGVGNFRVPTTAAPDPVTDAWVESGTAVSTFDYILNKDNGFAFPTTGDAAAPYGIWWADKTTEAKFTAWAPANITEGEYVVPGGQATQGYTASSDGRDSQEDIIVAYSLGKKNEFRSGVPLNFRHVLSRIQFKGVNKDYTHHLVVKVKNIKLVNINQKSQITFPTISTGNGFDWADYTPWMTSSEPRWYYGTEATATGTNTIVTLDATANNNITFGDDFYLMPQQLVAADEASMSKDQTNASEFTEFQSKQYVAFQICAYSSTECTETNDPDVWKAAGSAANAMIYPYATNTDGKFVTKKEALDNTGNLKTGMTRCTTTTPAYAWAAVPLDTKWEPGKKYIYTLNYSALGLGMSDPEDSITPVEPIIEDSPLKLWFTVDVVDWEEVEDTKTL